MEENRRAVVYLSLALIFGFFVIVVTQEVAGFLHHTFYWGVPFGLLVGLGTCVYLNHVWDPYYLQPRNSDASRASWGLWWVVPLGVVSATLLSRTLNESAFAFVIGILISWIFITFSYIAFQAWRFRPK